MVDAYGEIRAVQFAPATPCAPVRIHLGRNAIVIQYDTFPRAERSADPAGFAPIAKDIYLETLAAWFRAFSLNSLPFFGLARAPAFAPPGQFALLLIAFHMPSKYKYSHWNYLYTYRRKTRF
jgi:hypothetical protein